jgi:hypothetical protein
MLDRNFYRRVRLLRGREESISFRFELDEDDQLVEHVTVEVPDAFLEATEPAR